VRMAFEDRSVRIPWADDNLKSDIRAIRKEVTSSGNVRFAADRGTNGHADRFWGLALALRSARDAGNFTFPPRPGGRRSRTMERTVQ